MTALRKLFYILTFIFAFISCSENGSNLNDHKNEIIAIKDTEDTLQTDKEKTSSERLSLKNIAEVVEDSKVISWVGEGSFILHFFEKDQLNVSYGQGFWLWYPIKTENESIIVYWDNSGDSKYDFDILKAIKKVDEKYLGKPFMILELVNDTTLKATYPIPELIIKLNSIRKNQTLFAEEYIASPQGF